MKTPRQILFQRYQSAEPKLDAIRRRALDNIAPAQRTPGIREMFFSLRWHLAGMGAAWLLVAFLNIDHSQKFTAKVDPENIPSPRKLLADIRENRRQVLELLELPIAEPVPPPRRNLPRRRSELRTISTMA